MLIIFSKILRTLFVFFVSHNEACGDLVALSTIGFITLRSFCSVYSDVAFFAKKVAALSVLFAKEIVALPVVLARKIVVFPAAFAKAHVIFPENLAREIAVLLARDATVGDGF